MPFDATKLRDPRIAVLPPTEPPTGPPEGGGPRRVVINIEIVQRPPAPSQRRGRDVLAVILWLLALIVLAHADDGGMRYEHWQDTNGWHDETRTEGRTTDWTAYGPHGQQKHCHRYFVGDQAYTSCN
jgi:hypothetical protein